MKMYFNVFSIFQPTEVSHFRVIWKVLQLGSPEKTLKRFMITACVSKRKVVARSGNSRKKNLLARDKTSPAIKLVSISLNIVKRLQTRFLERIKQMICQSQATTSLSKFSILWKIRHCRQYDKNQSLKDKFPRSRLHSYVHLGDCINLAASQRKFNENFLSQLNLSLIFFIFIIELKLCEKPSRLCFRINSSRSLLSH